MSRFQKVTTALSAVVLWLGVRAQVALAQATPADPTGGASQGFLDQVTAWIADQGSLIIIGLLFVGAAWALLVKFSKRGTRTV